MYKAITNNYDHEFFFDNLNAAKAYFWHNPEYYPDMQEFVNEMENCETLEEFVDVLNKYSDEFGNGSTYRIKTY